MPRATALGTCELHIAVSSSDAKLRKSHRAAYTKPTRQTASKSHRAFIHSIAFCKIPVSPNYNGYFYHKSKSQKSQNAQS